MSGILHIDKGPSPHWWLSPDIWVTPVGDPTTFPGVGNPIAGDTYNVSVKVHDNYKESVTKGWNLFVCWAIPTAGPIPIPPAAQILNNIPIPVTVPPLSFVQLETASKWTPTFVNGGHECLIAMAYNEGAIGFPVTSLDSNAADTDTYSIAQKNLGVVQVKMHMKAPFHYAFQACNGADAERQFVLTAQQAPLSDIAAFLPGMPGGKSILQKPGQDCGPRHHCVRQARWWRSRGSVSRDCATQLPAVHAERCPARGQRAGSRHAECERGRGRRAQRVGHG